MFEIKSACCFVSLIINDMRSLFCCIFCSLFQPMYESWFISLYTTLYTSLPIQCMGFFEQVSQILSIFDQSQQIQKLICPFTLTLGQDVSAKSCLRWPEIYSVGHKKQLFNPFVLAVTLLYSFYTSIILFFIPMGILQYSALDYQTLAITVETSVVLTTTIEVTRRHKQRLQYLHQKQLQRKHL